MPGPDAAVELAISGLPAALRHAKLAHYRIDEQHGNAYAAWKRMGSPIAPTRGQYNELEAASRLAVLEEPRSASVDAKATWNARSIGSRRRRVTTPLTTS